MTIRDERESDIAEISRITRAAFAEAEHASGKEADVIETLRRDDALAISLVAEGEEGLSGHIAFSKVSVGGADRGWYGLGPMSVRPDLHGEGIGGRLVDAGLTRLREMGAGGCVVLGDPGYYGRFGFRDVPAMNLPGVPDEYFLMLPFGTDVPTGPVAYHPAFEGA